MSYFWRSMVLYEVFMGLQSCLSPTFLVLVLISYLSAQVSTDPANTSIQLKPGVVVEVVAKNSEAERAGIQVGDVLLSWEYGSIQANISSPFELSWVELDEGPRGPVLLRGVRNGEELRWTIEPGSWGMDGRFALAGTLLAAYEKGQHSLADDNIMGAAESWQQAATVAPEHSLLRSWFFFKAAQLLSSKGQWKEAESAYEQGLQQGADAGGTTGVQLLRARVLSYEQQRDWENAQKYLNQALALCEQSGLHGLGVATLLNDLGYIARSRGDIARSEKDYQQAWAIAQQLAPESLSAATSLHGLGYAAFERGDSPEAEKYYLQALRIRVKFAPGSMELAMTLNNLGNVMQEEGDLERAREYALRSLEIKRALMPESLSIANTLHNIGGIESKRGDLASAEQYYRMALEIRERLAPESPTIVDSFAELGKLAKARELFPTAKEYETKALILAEKLLPDTLTVALIYVDLGNVAQEERRFIAAKSFYRRALRITNKRAPNGLNAAWILLDLGTLAARTGRYASAENYYQRSLAIGQRLQPTGPIITQLLLNLGRLASARGQTTKAIDYFNRARAITERIAPDTSDYVDAVGQLGKQMWLKHQFEAALQLYAKAMDALEVQISHLGASDEARSQFRANRKDYYRNYIVLSLQEGKPDAAFQIYERFRARSLLETLAAAGVDIHEGTDPELLEHERSLRLSLNNLRDRRVALLTGNHTSGQVEAVEKEIEGLRADYDQLENRIRETSPAYAALTQPQPLSPHEVQQLLDQDTLLLEYWLREDHSYLWAVTSSSVTVHKLPDRRTIEATARRLCREVSAVSSTEMTADESKQQRQTEMTITATALSRMILGPVAAELGRKRLFVVADGALQYVPFAFLPESGRPGGLPLILKHEIVYSPSASVLAELRREANGRHTASKAVAILADPVFDRDDPRVNIGREPAKRPARSEASSLLAQHLTRAATDVGLAHLPRLAFSRREADAIMALLPAGQGMEAVDFEANRSTATNHDLAQYRVIHFATHALSDNRHPEFSGLVLSMVDQRGRPQNGFLELQDIYNLNLPAELVVLSGCETALGKEVQGEGLLGLTRGFMYAGATRVIASLWNADDVSTKELMEKFYRAMEREGMRPAAALRAAQVAMWRQHRWKDPYYWAAFEIQGEWN